MSGIAPVSCLGGYSLLEDQVLGTQRSLGQFGKTQIRKPAAGTLQQNFPISCHAVSYSTQILISLALQVEGPSYSYRSSLFGLPYLGPCRLDHFLGVPRRERMCRRPNAFTKKHSTCWASCQAPSTQNFMLLFQNFDSSPNSKPFLRYTECHSLKG